MISALIAGHLTKRATKTAKNGNEFTLATVKVVNANTTSFWIVLAFADHVRAALDEIPDGAAISATGNPRFEIWTPEGGEPRINCTLLADTVVGLRRTDPTKRPVRTAPKPPPQQIPMTVNAPRSDAGADAFNDEIPL